MQNTNSYGDSWNYAAYAGPQWQEENWDGYDQMYYAGQYLLNGDSTVEEYQEEVITPPPEPEWSVAMSRRTKRNVKKTQFIKKEGINWNHKCDNPGECGSQCQNVNGNGILALSESEDVEMEYVKVKAVMDSGAHDIVVPARMIGDNEIRETKRSKSGYKWRDVKGNSVRNIGETNMVGESHDGIPVDFVAQVSDETKKLLMSVRKAAEKGNMVIFGADINAIKKLAKLDKIEENMIVNHKNGSQKHNQR